MYLSKYKALGLNIKGTSNKEVSAICPLHDDGQASLSFNVDNGLWCCHAGCGGGNYEQFVERLESQAVKDPEISAEVIEKLHADLISNEQCLAVLKERRGLSVELVKQFKLGITQDKIRLSIPVTKDGKFVNIRQHAVFKKVQPKIVSYKPGFGKIRLFPEQNIDGQGPVVICEGELKALLLIQLGFRAISPTGGAQYWNPQWTSRFKGQDVILVYDVDQAGRKGAMKIAKLLKGVAASVKNVNLPINLPNKDVADYVLNSGASATELEKLFNGTPLADDEGHQRNAEAMRVTLSDASGKEYIDKYLKIDVTATGKDLAPFAIPEKVKFRCGMGMKLCQFCPVGAEQGTLERDIDVRSKNLLKLIDVPEHSQKLTIQNMFNIPSKCPKVNMDVLKWINIEEIKLLPKIDYVSNPNQEYVVRQAYYIGHGLKVNQDYTLECLSVAHPQNQYVTFLADKVIPLSDSLEGFQLSAEQAEKLKVFKPKSNKLEDMQDKMKEIADDLMLNVAKIYDRNEICHAFDLVYHSARHFYFEGELVIKGWIEGLVAGDTRTGKTETVRKLIGHYRAGELVTAENSSFAGLIGGMQQNNKRWTITWGVLPRNDKRAIAIDELSGMPLEDIGRLSGARSSGIAEITKIQTERTFSRTRIIWVSNARSNRSMNTYTTGVDVIKELIGRPEDIARFDFALLIGSNEVDIGLINNAKKPHCKHVFTSDLCHQLVMWAWSRRPEDIILTKETEEECRKLAKEFGSTYSADLPLVEPAEQRIKFARMAISVAIRLFSSEDGQKVIVLPEHVRIAASLLKTWYGKKVFNYEGYSRIRRKENTIGDEKAILKILSTYGKELVENLLDCAIIKVQDMQDFTAVEEKAKAQSIISELVRLRALKRMTWGYVKTPGFINLLRTVYDNPDKMLEPQKPKEAEKALDI